MYGRHFRGAPSLARVPTGFHPRESVAPGSIRPAKPSDAETCGRIIYEAFHGIAADHGFLPDFPTIAAATELARSFIANPAVFGVVAEQDGEIVGSNFLSEGDAIRGVGPITVAPHAQGLGIGRQLMQAVVERANGAAGIRLLQDAFNMRSLSLYASLGFEVREPVALMTGRLAGKPAAGVTVRSMTEADLDACDAVCIRVHGISRRSELGDAVRLFAPRVAERAGRITAYMTAPTFWLANHAVAESMDDMQGLLAGVGAVNTEPFSFLLPTRQSALFRWCLKQGLRAAKPMTLMTMGEYRYPNGAYISSVLY